MYKMAGHLLVVYHVWDPQTNIYIFMQTVSIILMECWVVDFVSTDIASILLNFQYTDALIIGQNKVRALPLGIAAGFDGGREEGQVCAAPGARTPIGTSGI